MRARGRTNIFVGLGICQPFTGIDAAKARGVYTGRAVGSTKANPGRARELKRKELSMEEIATALGVSKRTVTRSISA